MISLLREVGRGKRGARDLTYEEARKAAEWIINGHSTPAQTGAFLVAERLKLESMEELKAFIDVLSENSLKHPIAGGLDCAGPYDGRSKSFMATLPAAFVVAACGVPATLHGSASLPPKYGVTLLDVIDRLTIRLERDILVKAATETNFLFIPTEQWCPPLAQLRQLREELGLRTVYNSAEKLLRLSEASTMVLGVFHGTVFEKMAQLIIQLGFQSGMVVQGLEGSEDLPVDKRTRTLVIKDGGYSLFIIDPEIFGLGAEYESAESEWTVERQLQTTLAVLRNEGDLACTNMVILNAAVRLWIHGAASSIEDGIAISRAAIRNGTALRQWDRWLELVR
jgi:anthranilate phosphoribosyltransferase